jgi:hypothetical protein
MDTSRSLLGQAIIPEPATNEDNVIQPLIDSVSGLIIRRHSATQSAPLLRLQTEKGVDLTTFDANGVPTGAAAPVLLTAIVSLTSAQIKTLDTVPVEMVAAPGAGNVLQLLSYSIFQKIGSNVWLTPDPVNISILAGVGGVIVASDQWSDVNSGFLTQSSQLVVSLPTVQISQASKIDIDNKSLVMKASGAFTGNAANDTTWKVVTTYAVHAAGW